VDFSIPKNQRPQMAAKIMERLKHICTQESVDVESDVVLSKLVVKYFPDYRRIINEAQRYSTRTSTNRKLDMGILNISNQNSDLNIDTLTSAFKARDFMKIQEWTVNALSIHEPVEIYRKIYDSLREKKMVAPQSIPDCVVILSEYGYRSAFVVDQEVNLLACLVDILTKCEMTKE
jgi:hypothetical protein